MLLIFYYIQYYNQIPLYTHLCSFWGLFPQDTFLDLELLGQRGAPSEDSRCTLPSASQRGWLPLALPVPATRLSPLSSALTLGRLRRLGSEGPLASPHSAALPGGPSNRGAGGQADAERPRVDEPLPAALLGRPGPAGQHRRLRSSAASSSQNRLHLSGVLLLDCISPDTRHLSLSLQCLLCTGAHWISNECWLQVYRNMCYLLP